MDDATAVGALSEAIRVALVLAVPLLLAALVVGGVVGVIQTMCQLHEPTVALVPRLAAVAVAGLVLLPWLIGRWVAYAGDLWTSIPTRLGG